MMLSAPQALAALIDLIGQEPDNPAHRQDLAKLLVQVGRREEAIARLREAVAALPGALGCWMDLVTQLVDQQRWPEAEATLDEALAGHPDDRRLLEAKAFVLRVSGDLARTQAYLQALATRFPDRAWIHFHLGDAIGRADWPRAEYHLRRALDLEPDNPDHLFGLMQGLERWDGPGEGAKLDEAYGLATRALALDLSRPARAKLTRDVLLRVCAFDDIPRLGAFADVGRRYAQSGLHSALFRQLPQARTREDRLELIEQHRIWGRAAEARARAAPIRSPAPRPPREKLRLGFMSSDLRRHPVGYFAQPLFDHVDRDQFEVFAYSFYRGTADAVQQVIAGQVTGFRNLPNASARGAAQAIADDDLDMLIELGGSTYLNKLEVMAWRPAPQQASWLGYPASAGLSTIDYLICDPYMRPADPALILETPLVMPRTWLALGPPAFSEREALTPRPPSDRNSFVTYGSANDPQKYGRDVLAAWARIVAATPGSRFAFIRPEAGSAAFRHHVEAEFARQGVAADRLIWRAVRGGHLAHYGDVDISLDTFPLTGGTTTAECLWMGVPLVTLVGQGMHERLSYSILSNAGLGDLCADNLDDYHRIALELAADTDRRRYLRSGLRDQLRSSPLGQTEDFARDFYGMIQKAIAERPGLKRAE